MNYVLNNDCRLPMYEQIKEYIKQDILEGKLKHDDVLPSVRQLSKTLNVSIMTIKRAYMELENESFAYTISGKGTFVKVADYSKIIEDRNKQLLEELKVKVQEINKAGISKEKTLEIIENSFKGNTLIDNDQIN